jgi:putative tricarboxylic transport membrane protein
VTGSPPAGTGPDQVVDPPADPPTVQGDPPWRHDLVAGLLAAALGAAVVLHVRTFPELPDGQPGPALFPGIIGSLLVVFGLVLAVRAVLARGRAEAGAQRPAGQDVLRALAVVGLVVTYLLLAEVLGFAITMGVLLFLLMWLLGARPLVAAVAAAVTTGAILLLFQEVLLVPLPTGPLG